MGSFGFTGLSSIDPLAMRRKTQGDLLSQFVPASRVPIGEGEGLEQAGIVPPPTVRDPEDRFYNIDGRPMRTAPTVKPLGQYLSQTPQAFQPGPMPGPAPQPQVELPESQGTMQKAMALSGVQGLGQTGQMQALTPEQQRVYGKGPLQQAYEDQAQHGAPQAHGFMSHLKGAGMGLLLGGLPGAVTGAINPQIINNIRHQIGLGQMAQQADQEMQGQQHQQRGMQDYGQQTGQIYGTGTPTL